MFNLEKRLPLRDLTGTQPIPTWELLERQKQTLQRFNDQLKLRFRLDARKKNRKKIILRTVKQWSSLRLSPQQFSRPDKALTSLV